MHWDKNTLSVLHDLQKDKSYTKWSNAVKAGRINNFSDDLNHLLARLSGLIITELGVSVEDKDKIVKIMELAAVAGETVK